MRRLILILSALLAFTACSNEGGKADRNNINFSPLKVGGPATDFYHNDMDGKPFRLSGYRGKTVLVYFWRLKCKECVASMDSLDALYKKFKDRGLVVVAVGADNMHSAPLSKVAGFIDSHGFTFINIRDDNGIVAEAFDALVAPETYIIDKNGNIASIIKENVSDWMSPDTVKSIEPLLD